MDAAPGGLTAESEAEGRCFGWNVRSFRKRASAGRSALNSAITEAVEHAHELILVGGALGLASLFAGLASARLGAPLLLVFLVAGMLAGEDGPGGIEFSDFNVAYLIGSVALAAILFDGGLKTKRSMLKVALWPAAAMATGGVAITTAIVGASAVTMFGVPWVDGLAIGAALAPTDAAAVAMLLHRARVGISDRVTALLEVESGLNDPMSVVLTVALVQLVTNPAGMTAGQAGLLLLEEVGGGVILGAAGGWALLAALRRVSTVASVLPVLALAAVLAVFGGAQVLGTSGFLAVYLMGVMAGNGAYPARAQMVQVFEAFAWLAQVTLFLMLGLAGDPACTVAARNTDPGDLGRADPGRPSAGDVPVPPAVRLHRKGVGVRVLGGPAGRSADLSHAPSRAGRGKEWRRLVRRGLRRRGDVIGGAGVDDRPSRSAARLPTALTIQLPGTPPGTSFAGVQPVV